MSRIEAPISLAKIFNKLINTTSPSGQQLLLDTVTLCTSDRINKLSLYKPVPQLSQFTELTESDRMSKNYGNILRWYDNPIECLHEMISESKGINYDAENALGFCRLTDFEGYEHDMNAWVKGYFERNPVSNSSNGVISFNNSLISPLDFFNWEILNGYNPFTQNINMCLAFCRNNTFTSTVEVLGLTNAGVSIGDLLSNETLSFDTNELSEGTYYVLPLFTNGNYTVFPDNRLTVVRSDTTGYSWWPVYGADVLTLQVTGSGGIVPSEYVSISVEDAIVTTIDPVDGIYEIYGIDISFVNKTNAIQDVNITAVNLLDAIKIEGNFETASITLQPNSADNVILNSRDTNIVKIRAPFVTQARLQIEWDVVGLSDSGYIDVDLIKFVK